MWLPEVSTSIPRLNRSSAIFGVRPKPPAAFSPLATTRSMTNSRRSCGRRRATASRPGRPMMSPIASTVTTIGRSCKAVAIEALLRGLPTLTIGATFNQFRDTGTDDLPDAPAIRLANLGLYLEERREADVLAVGEAAGYQGMRWSGIAFTSEFDLLRG